MKLIETMGIEQARRWKVASLNEFRKFFKLEPYKHFSDMTSDKSVQASLETLYGHPDYVELYPGLVAEDAKEPWKPGSGLCPGFTLSRTILADAVALTRGDRFCTVVSRQLLMHATSANSIMCRIILQPTLQIGVSTKLLTVLRSTVAV